MLLGHSIVADVRKLLQILGGRVAAWPPPLPQQQRFVLQPYVFGGDVVFERQGAVVTRAEQQVGMVWKDGSGRQHVWWWGKQQQSECMVG